MKIDRYVPEQTLRPEAICVAPYPFMGNTRNTSPRMQAIANALGMQMLGYERYATCRTTIDLGARKRLRPSPQLTGGDLNCPEPILEAAELMDINTDAFEEVYAMGDSSGGVELKGLILAGMRCHRALFRDATNLRSPQKPVVAQYGYFKYQVLEERRKGQNSVAVSRSLEPFKPKVTRQSTWRTIGHAVTEIAHYSPLWRSEWDKRAMLQIAAHHTDLTVLHIGFGHSFTGSRRQAEDYALSLSRARTTAPGTARLEAAVRPSMYHSDLLHPRLAIAHMLELQTM